MIAAPPGLSWVRENPEKLIVYLLHGELEILGGDLSRAAFALLELVANGPCDDTALISKAHKVSGASVALCRYASRVLEDARCLRQISDLETITDLEWLNWIRTGDKTYPDAIASLKVGALCYVELASEIERAFTASGIIPNIKTFEPGTTTKDASAYLETLAGRCDAIVVAGPRLGHPFMKMLGRTAAKFEMPITFVESAGVVARVGPTILGHDLPCLDCLNARHAANAGATIDRKIDEISTVGTIDLPPAPLVHPNLKVIALQSVALELNRLAMSEAPQTFGGYLEISWDGQIKRRSILRVPLCTGCSPASVERFPFHVTPITA